MKILQIISYGYLAGGAEKSVVQLKENLQASGHQVKIVTSDHGQGNGAKRFSDIEFPEIDRPGTSLITKMVRHMWYRPSYRTIKKACAEFQPDIVHFHVMGQLSPSALFAVGKIPAVLTVHGPEEYVTGILEWGFPKRLFKNERVAISNLTLLGWGYYLYFRFMQRPLYLHGLRKHVRTLIAPSRYMARVLQKEAYGVPVRHIYNGIALPEYRPLRNTHQLLYVGRLEYVKGVDVLLEALGEVVKRIPDVRLSIVGEGATRQELEAFVSGHKLQKHVAFRGWLKGPAVSEQYTEATIVVIPSIWPENLPTVCIEALASGRPVIGSKSGGIPELIKDGATGSVVAPGDAKQLAVAIIELLERSDLSKVSRACAASMKDFKITTFIHNLGQLYQQVIKQQRETT